jgi:hypothetical protein
MEWRHGHIAVGEYEIGWHGVLDVAWWNSTWMRSWGEDRVRLDTERMVINAIWSLYRSRVIRRSSTWETWIRLCHEDTRDRLLGIEEAETKTWGRVGTSSSCVRCCDYTVPCLTIRTESRQPVFVVSAIPESFRKHV